MSLITCMKKAGKALSAEDRAAIHALSRQYRAQGLSATAAGRKAISDQLVKVEGELAAALIEAKKPKGETGLTAPTKADVLAQQQRAKDGAAAEVKAKKEEAQRADADAERGDFTLTGSDRRADADPNQRGMFALPPPSDGDGVKVKQIGKRWAVVQKAPNGGEQHAYYDSEAEARAAAAKLGQIAHRAPGPEGAWDVEDRAEPVRAEGDERSQELGLAVQRVVAKRAADSIRSADEAIRRQANGELKQDPTRAGYCYRSAAEGAAAGVGDMVIGKTEDGHGNPIWHAVITRDGAIYDPTLRQWFEPGVYEALGFEAKKTLTTAEVRAFIQRTGGLVPDARNQGLEPGGLPAMDAARLRQAFGKDDAPLAKTEVQEIVERLIAGWKNPPNIHFALPAHAPATARGYYNGEVWINPQAHRTFDQVARTLAHEAIAHHGLENILTPAQWQNFMRAMHLAIASGNKPLKAARDYVRRVYGDKLGDKERSHEIAAKVIEDAVDPATGEFRPGFSWLKSVWAQVADWLRSIGIDVPFTRAELHGMLVLAQRNLETGKRLQGGAELVLAAKASDSLVTAPGGGLDFGEITSDMSKKMRRQAGKIRLQEGEHRTDGTGYGLVHIEANHGKQIRNAGFESVQAFVSHVGGSFDEVLQAALGRQLLVAVTDGRKDVMFVQLEAAEDGDFYRVNTAFPASRDYLEKQEKKGAKILWSGSEPRTAVAGQQPPYAGTPDKSSGQTAPIAQGQSTPASGVSGIVGDGQAKPNSAADRTNGVGGPDASAGRVAAPGQENADRLRQEGLADEGSGKARPTGEPDARGDQGSARGDEARQRLGQGTAGEEKEGLAALAPPDLFTADSWNTPEPTKLDNVIYELQDGRVDLKRVQQAIKAAGRQIEEKFDARLAETNYPGRVARRSEQFLEREVKPLLLAMARDKATMDELADYLIARHAPERNAQVARVNPDLPDGGAGRNSAGTLMTDAAAATYLEAIPAARRAQLATLADKVDAITRGTRGLLVAEGLEKADTVAAWEGAYSNYVPLFKDEAEHPHPQGMGFAVKGPASKRATGSTKQVTNVLAHVLMQREAAITRAEKNRVGLALYGLALSHPNPAFWATIKPGMSNEQIGEELVAMGVDPTVATAGMQGVPTIRTVDPILDRVVDRPNPIYKSLPGAITLRVNGEDRVLMLNQKDERALRMAEALKNLDGLTAFDLAGSIVGKTTRWMAAVNTQYNPAFGLVNLVRDTLGGSVNLGSTALRGNTFKVLGNVPAAMQGIARELAGGGESSEWSRLWKQFQDDGGRTGYREMFRQADDRAKAIERELAIAEKAGKLTPGKVGHAILDLLDGFNTTLENAVRLSAYKAGLDKGLSRAEAARLGRELTVDFNRKGRTGRELGPLYAFFNASLQGGARTIETLRGPTGARIIAGGLALGAIQTLLLLAADYDDEDIPEFVKTRSLIIPLPKDAEGKKRHIAIPYPLGLHVLPNTGRVITELSLNGGKDIGKRAFNAVGEISGAFNPLGGGNIFTAHGALTTIAPTVVDPVIDIAANKNFAGRPIQRESPRGELDNRPGYQRARESTMRSTTGQVYLGISKAINALTGGTAYEAGLASPTPEMIRHIAQTAGGGVLRELEKTVDSSVRAINGEDVKMSGIPVTGRFYGEVDANQVEMSRFYEKGKKLEQLQSSLNAAKKAGDGEAMVRMIKDHPEIALIKFHDEVQRELSKLNKVAVSTVGDQQAIKLIDEARVKQMKAFNDALKKLEQANSEVTLGQKLRGAVRSQEVAAQ